MKIQKIALAIMVVSLLLVGACKAKRCASFENQDKEFKLKRDRNGNVKR